METLEDPPPLIFQDQEHRGKTGPTAGDGGATGARGAGAQAGEGGGGPRAGGWPQWRICGVFESVSTMGGPERKENQPLERPRRTKKTT